MDAASRTGVNDIRELLDGVPYRPVTARYKVYIIDEVHMLSTQAFNALLKTLEEPPEHVRFIFATTEIRKVPVTVLSRCQRFDLRRISTDTLTQHLRDIAGRENAVVSEAALALIARAADGSVRDALSLLDQAIVLSDGPVEDASVREMLGLADRTQIFDLFDSMLLGEVGGALATLRSLYAAGADPAVIIEDLLDLTHWLVRCKVAPDSTEAPAVPQAERVRGGDMAKRLAMAELTRAWQMLLKALGEVRWAPSPIQAAEVGLVRLAYAASLPTPAEAIQSLKRQPSPAASAPANPPAAVGPSPGLSPLSAQTATSGPVTGFQHGSGPATARAKPAPSLPHADGTPDRAPRASSFDDVVQMAREGREAILHGHLIADVRLVRFEPGRIELQLTERAPGDLPQRLSRFLGERTGERWLVTVSHGDAAPTLREQHEASQAQRLAELAEHPLIAALLRQFPGATISGIRTITPPEAPAIDDADAPALDTPADGDGDGDGEDLLGDGD
jgi:DNA polymerase-3 subunit gamma/tau